MPGGDVGGHVQVFMVDPTESTLPPEPTGIRNPGGRRRSDSPLSTNRSRESSITVRNVIQTVRRELGERWRQRTEEQRQENPSEATFGNSTGSKI